MLHRDRGLVRSVCPTADVVSGPWRDVFVEPEKQDDALTVKRTRRRDRACFTPIRRKPSEKTKA